MRTRFWVELLFLIAGPVIWLVHYLFIYIVNALHCARPQSWLGTVWMALPISSWVILCASALALSAMTWAAIRQHQRIAAYGLPKFHAKLTIALCLLSGLAVVWQTLPVFMVSECR
ncbi:hypothetical protein [Bordetella genomosp. 4]|uniref:Uncharacterized protein n=1 Tax=Bordetella genomosp. 4 TaxID=463044 RepID=A0A261U3R6_9BORD|nr:hypothetical protein [Bordetella genomosp. 4]OZI49584.1 hypothetical protein CAL21_08425 [Bordetella genomosp. 4]OZI56032.1 hypothetical protein CAL20_11300 [Bordetella genomosp. 4]